MVVSPACFNPTPHSQRNISLLRGVKGYSADCLLDPLLMLAWSSSQQTPVTPPGRHFSVPFYGEEDWGTERGNDLLKPHSCTPKEDFILPAL